MSDYMYPRCDRISTVQPSELIFGATCRLILLLVSVTHQSALPHLLVVKANISHP